jgi:hypothetical protein
MTHINTTSITLNLVCKALGYEPYSTQSENLTKQYWDILGNITEAQHKYLRALAYNHKVEDIKKILTDWEIMYHQEDHDNCPRCEGD